MRHIDAKELLIPIAILLAGAILAGAVYVVRIKHTVEQGSGTPEAVRPIQPTDHLIGNPAAPVAIIEYADIDSSYSKSFQLVMEQLMTEYAGGDKVVWVYRHFPVTDLHPDAATNALAAECIASLSSPLAFFHIVDAMEAAAPGDNEYDPTQYPDLVSQFGVDNTQFATCMANGAFSKKIHDDYDNALASGATGSPFVVLLIHGQKPVPINGALPYASMKKIIDDSIAKTGG